MEQVWEELGFVWPLALGMLLLLPLLVWAYRAALARPSRQVVYHPYLKALQAAAVAGRSPGQHLPAVLFLLALVALIVAMARPVLPFPAYRSVATVVLAIDTSRSMRAEDLEPSRLEAAKAAAREFIRAMPPGVEVGLVAFSSYATLLQPPTTDRERLEQAVDLLDLAHRTAIGDGLVAALRVLPLEDSDAPGGMSVVLLSDGRNNYGIDPLEAARQAEAQGVRVYTVGVGLSENTYVFANGYYIRAGLDEETLQEIAALTGGAYYRASSADELRAVYQTLARAVRLEVRPTEVTALAALAGALLLIVAVLVAWVRVYRIG
ncbi:VWA domain-containing protein [Marinithermus hydrothermalis]|uniref:von Willebrand factor type A n=1 Tax=Marinithermus hydrothermalis (strain DSM 14884 / JCM 11576 / T1) TaxID=869210 RepID=F2NPK4_MARHT|nr:VWA domain-containing protein [Marinithermus hydrothermalis]AEB12505.1 von Willebrand factor type A [Marinithermus hydrothermalis DSM 14884]